MTIRTENATTLEEHLRSLRSSGRKILVPYITGFADGWVEALHAVAANGADAVEVGIPFSDPVMDGPVIQRASLHALANGANVPRILDAVRNLDIGIPILTMCYYNTVYRFGHERFASELRRSGVSGAIIPDLPLEETGEWCTSADAAGIATVLLAAPTADDDRLSRIVARARGFVYSVGLLGVTGERDALAATATTLATRLKQMTDRPVLVGVGVSSAQQAREACEVADGVIMGASVMRRLLEEGPESVGSFIAEVRRALSE